jgi:putative oxidoreductase
LNKWLASKPLQWTIALALGGFFVYASLAKIQEPRAFARVVYHYRLLGPSEKLPHALPNAFAVTLPWIEAITGLLIITGFWRREASILCALMLVMFLAAVGWALAHNIDIENCGCIDPNGKGRPAGIALILEDSAMLMAALLLARMSRPAAKA